jgi:hypothetical protein
VKQPEILGIELEDNGDITARFLVEQKWTWSNAAARHLGVLLIRATDPKPAPVAVLDDE